MIASLYALEHGRVEWRRWIHAAFAAVAAVAIFCAAAVPLPCAAAPGDAGEKAAAPADTAGTRTIAVTLVADGDFRSLPGWETLARDAVDRASRKLLPSAGIGFRVREEIAWDRPGDASDLARILEEGRAAFGGRNGLVAIFSGPRSAEEGDLAAKGYATLGRPFLVVAPHRDGAYRGGYHMRDDLTRTFLHEVGHTFGLPHLRGRNIMAGRWDEVTDDFDELSLDVLRANRNLRFGTEEPFVGSDLATLRDVYLFWDERGEGEPVLLANLGFALLREGRPEAARAPLERARRARELAGPAEIGLARCALALGDTAAARDAATRASEAPDLAPDALGAIGNLWLALADPAAADRLFGASVASDSTRFVAWYNRGVSRYSLRRFADAASDFRRALTLEDRPEAWFNLGLALEAMEDVGAASAAFSRYLEATPEAPRAATARKHLDRLREKRTPAPER